MKNLKIAQVILGTVFSVQVLSPAVANADLTGLDSSVATVAPVTVVSLAPTPLTYQVLTNQPGSAFVNHPLLNKITELVNLAEQDGMQRDWYMSAIQVNSLNNMAVTNNQNDLYRYGGNLIMSILTNLYRGRVTPDMLGQKVNVSVRVKSVPNEMKNSIRSYANNEISAADLFSLYRPKNQNYTKLLTIYRKMTAMQAAGQVIPKPAKLGVVMPGSTDRATILFARQRLEMFGYENDVNNPMYTDDLMMAIKDLQENNLLKRDGKIGSNSFGLLNTPIDQIITRLKINLDRSRWLPDDLKSEHVHINLAAQRLFYYKDNVITLSFRTVNGKPMRPTPIMFDTIQEMKLNPTWAVPPTIYFEDKVPKFKDEPGYAAEKHFRFYDIRSGIKTEVAVTDIDWLAQMAPEKVAYGKATSRLDYLIVQSPGPWNALGFIKFPLMRNGKGYYMHDTDRRDLFGNVSRLESSGCIRMEKPFELAEKLLSGQIDSTTGLPIWTVDSLKASSEMLVPYAEEETPVSLGRVVPVYVLYETAQINDRGQMALVSDPYGTDMDTYNLMMGIPLAVTATPAVAGAAL